MPTNTASVSQLYSSIAPLENRRLLDHPMERELTLRTIRKALAASTPGLVVKKRIADIGGGPGRIAFALADDGHEVDLVDLTPELVQLAEAEQERRRVAEDITSKRLLRSIAVGNALEKDAGVGLEEEGGYDAVLLLGPLYHLVEEEERVTAVRNAVELVRRESGLVFVAFVSVAAHLRDVAVREPGRMVEMRGFYEEYVGFSFHFLGDMRYQVPDTGFMSTRIVVHRPVREEPTPTGRHHNDNNPVLPHLPGRHPRLLCHAICRLAGAH